MHNASRDVQPDGRNDNCSAVVSDLVSLIDHMQASMKMLEAAIARELPLGGQEADGNVIVLDDITPCYMKANAALHACKAGLGIALHFLAGSGTSNSRVVGFTGSDRRLGSRRKTHQNKSRNPALRPSSEPLGPERRRTMARGGRRFVHKIFGDEQP